MCCGPETQVSYKTKMNSSTMKTLSKVAPPFLSVPITKAGYANFLEKVLTFSFVAYVLLASVGTSAGFLTSTPMLALKDLILATFAFVIIAFAMVSKRISPAVPAGLTVLSAALYLLLSRLPNNTTWPNWIKEGKAGLANIAEESTKGLLVATAIFIA